MAEEQRSLALGVQSVMWRAFGSIPGPILFGVLFDSSCLYWQMECNRRGNCWVYNNNSVSVRAFFVSMTGVLINTVFMILCWLLYPPILCRKGGNGSDKEGNKVTMETPHPEERKVDSPSFNKEEKETNAL